MSAIRHTNRVGTLEAGKDDNMLHRHRQPTEGLTAVYNIVAVFTRGRRHR